MRQSLCAVYMMLVGFCSEAVAEHYVTGLPGDDNANAVLAGVSQLMPQAMPHFMDGEFEVKHLGEDRYGRPQVIVYDEVISQVILGSRVSKKKQSFQESMLKFGDVILWDTGIEGLPYAKWLTQESEAREQNQGIWKTITIHPANEKVPQGKIEVVQGKVIDAQRKNGNIYINFGEDWKTDFTLFMPKEFAKHVEDEAIQALVGKTVLARGTVYDYYGPMMDLYRLEMLEIIE